MISKITAHSDIIDLIQAGKDYERVIGVVGSLQLVKSDIMPEGYGVLTDDKGNVVGLFTPPKGHSSTERNRP